MSETDNNSKKESEYGFDNYPERRSGKSELDWKERFTQAYDSEIRRSVCEANVVKAFKKHPLLKILSGALKSAGCPIDIKRHVVCEECKGFVQGGYDSEYNQIVICKNINYSKDNPEAVLIHELIHMYDYCINKVDFKNLEHLACTEIRAANLAHCSFLGAVVDKQASFFDIKNKHRHCVQMRATLSVMASRNLDFNTAFDCVLKVFDKCYGDLEPIGRRIRRNSEDAKLALEEAKCFKIYYEE